MEYLKTSKEVFSKSLKSLRNEKFKKKEKKELQESRELPEFIKNSKNLAKSQPTSYSITRIQVLYKIYWISNNYEKSNQNWDIRVSGPHETSKKLAKISRILNSSRIAKRYAVRNLIRIRRRKNKKRMRRGRREGEGGGVEEEENWKGPIYSVSINL